MEDAALAAYESFFLRTETEKFCGGVWKSLRRKMWAWVVTAPAIIEALNQQRQRMPDRGDRWIDRAHAVRLLATAQKTTCQWGFLPAGREKL